MIFFYLSENGLLEIDFLLAQGKNKFHMSSIIFCLKVINFQGRLSRIIEILRYYCRKQHKRFENSQNIDQNTISLPFSLLTATCASFALLNKRVFSVLGHCKSVSFKRHKWLFLPYIVCFSAWKMPFSKWSLAKYHCLHKKQCLK